MKVTNIEWTGSDEKTKKKNDNGNAYCGPNPIKSHAKQSRQNP